MIPQLLIATGATLILGAIMLNWRLT